MKDQTTRVVKLGNKMCDKIRTYKTSEQVQQIKQQEVRKSVRQRFDEFLKQEHVVYSDKRAMEEHNLQSELAVQCTMKSVRYQNHQL